MEIYSRHVQPWLTLEKTTHALDMENYVEVFKDADLGAEYLDLTPHGITRLGGPNVPRTFVIRTNEDNSVQIERRAALREAIDSID